MATDYQYALNLRLPKGSSPHYPREEKPDITELLDYLQWRLSKLAQYHRHALDTKQTINPILFLREPVLKTPLKNKSEDIKSIWKKIDWVDAKIAIFLNDAMTQLYVNYQNIQNENQQLNNQKEALNQKIKILERTIIERTYAKQEKPIPIQPLIEFKLFSILIDKCKLFYSQKISKFIIAKLFSKIANFVFRTLEPFFELLLPILNFGLQIINALMAIPLKPFTPLINSLKKFDNALIIKLGWDKTHTPTVAPYSLRPKTQNLNQVILTPLARFRRAAKRVVSQIWVNKIKKRLQPTLLHNKTSRSLLLKENMASHFVVDKGGIKHPLPSKKSRMDILDIMPIAPSEGKSGLIREKSRPHLVL